MIMRNIPNIDVPEQMKTFEVSHTYVYVYVSTIWSQWTT
jgi:hypothetical protein